MLETLKRLISYTYTPKPANKKSNEKGRSMIEMLGVLAIVGILSIGGIAGFSKAMYNHKLNKQAEQISHILAGMLENADQLRRESGVVSYYFTSVLISLGIIPDEMIKNNSTTYIYDAFDNKFSIYHVTNSTEDYYSMNIDIKNKGFGICRNLFEVAKAYHEFLMYAGASKGITGEGTTYKVAYGDNWCTVSRKNQGLCLDSISIAKMNELCNTCKLDTEHNCSFRIVVWNK